MLLTYVIVGCIVLIIAATIYQVSSSDKPPVEPFEFDDVTQESPVIPPAIPKPKRKKKSVNKNK